MDSKDPTREALRHFNLSWELFVQSSAPKDCNRGPWGRGTSGEQQPVVTARTPLLVYVTGRSAESFKNLVARSSPAAQPACLLRLCTAAITARTTMRRLRGRARAPAIMNLGLIAS